MRDILSLLACNMMLGILGANGVIVCIMVFANIFDYTYMRPPPLSYSIPILLINLTGFYLWLKISKGIKNKYNKQ